MENINLLLGFLFWNYITAQDDEITTSTTGYYRKCWICKFYFFLLSIDEIFIFFALRVYEIIWGCQPLPLPLLVLQLQEIHEKKCTMIPCSLQFYVNLLLPEAVPLLIFLKNKFGQEMINDRNDPITKEGTTIDAVFARNIEK